jgi:hypothetical protein
LSITQTEYSKIHNAMLQLPIFQINIFIIFICFAQTAAGQNASITEKTIEILTYPYSDANPFPILPEKKSEIYSYCKSRKP